MKKVSPAIIALLLFIPIISGAKDWPNHGNIILRAGGGYSSVLGDFEDFLQHGGYGTLGVSFSMAPFMPLLNQQRFELFVDVDIQYNHNVMPPNDASFLSTTSLSGGPLFVFHVHPLFQPYMAVLGHFSVVYWNLDTLQMDDTLFRGGIAARVGVMMSFTDMVGLDVSARYMMFPLSETLYHTMGVSLGVTVTFGKRFFKAPGKTTAQTTLLENYTQGVDLFNQGKLESARDKFIIVKEEQPGFRNTDQYLARIEYYRNMFERAQLAYRAGEYLKALSLYRKLTDYYPESSKRIIQIKGILSQRIGNWESQAIRLYNQKNYRQAIVILKNIEVVEPGNRTVKLYLPRAEKRLEAINKLNQD